MVAAQVYCDLLCLRMGDLISLFCTQPKTNHVRYASLGLGDHVLFSLFTAKPRAAGGREWGFDRWMGVPGHGGGGGDGQGWSFRFSLGYLSFLLFGSLFVSFLFFLKRNRNGMPSQWLVALRHSEVFTPRANRNGWNASNLWHVVTAHDIGTALRLNFSFFRHIALPMCLCRYASNECMCIHTSCVSSRYEKRFSMGTHKTVKWLCVPTGIREEDGSQRSHRLYFSAM